MHRLGQNLESMPIFMVFHEQIGSGGLSREKQDFALRADCLYLNRQFYPRQVWHDYIRNKKVGSLDVCCLQSLKRDSKECCVKAT